ncbi:MAG: hypothetical protein JXM70_15305 [Pirellulales bacterium]|nr:hypothetical protein [Pirellulales bacterium]
MLLLVGCGPGNPLGRKAVSGKVTLNGQPLKSGSIEFSPQAENGVNSGAVITNGEYSIVTEKGLPVGKYTARIFASQAREVPKDMPPGPATAPAGVDLIPPEYSSQSTQVVEVKDDGPNEFNFDIVTRRR